MENKIFDLSHSLLKRESFIHVDIEGKALKIEEKNIFTSHGPRGLNLDCSNQFEQTSCSSEFGLDLSIVLRL